MKKSGDKQTWRQPIVLVGWAVVAGVLALAGCSKAKTSAPEMTASSASSQPGTNQVAAQPAPSGTAPGVAPVQAAGTVQAPGGQPDLAALQRTLIRWIVGHRREPANFQDFASSAGVTIPPPPPGQHYIITKSMHIELVNQNQ